MQSPRPATFVAASTALIAILSLALIAADRAGLWLPLRAVTVEAYRWAALLGAGALLLGAANVAWVHLRRIRQGNAGWLQSLALVATMVIVIAGGFAGPAGVQSPPLVWLFNHVLFPGQASLFALLVFFMAAAGYRLLRVDRTGGGWLLAGVLLVLFTQLPAAASLWPDLLSRLTVWLVEQPAMAAARGALLGSAVALLVTGIRFFFGDR